MTTSLTRFQIEGLHNTHTIDIPIEDNKLVLVGENGTGKSTVANFIFFFLTMQWKRMLSTQFASITATLNNYEHKFSRKNIEELASFPTNLTNLTRRVLPDEYLWHEIESLAEIDGNSREFQTALQRLQAFSGIPKRIIDQIIKESLQQGSFSLLKNLRKQIPQEKILYLPTYRRIERDLGEIFPDLDIEKWQRRKTAKYAQRPPKHIELVEFGMRDVEETLDQRMEEIRTRDRLELNQLMGEHLRDAIKGTYATVAPPLEKLNQYSVQDVTKRIRSDILPDEDKRQLETIIQKVVADSNVIGENRLAVHLFAKFIHFYEQQKNEEKDILEFVEVCNQYLSAKQFFYDDVTIETSILQENKNLTDRELNLEALSSGEKQIISLFSHLYLTQKSNFFVIIDEPELSLSVPWQQRFLPDILRRANGLIAVTHSPFVYDNELEPYTHSIEEFFKPFEPSPDIDTLQLSFLDEDDIPF